MTAEADNTTTIQKPRLLPAALNWRQVKTKSIAFIIEHSPCCLLSFAAGFIGLPMLYHNPRIELAFAIFGAVFGEWLGHRLFHKHDSCHHDTCIRGTLRRYAISLLIGLASWGLHQQLFHHRHDHEVGVHQELPSKVI